MTEIVDRRVRKSREAIFRAFERLLSEKSYTSISVSDIIDEADVGRTTFYAHFPTKDALLDSLCADIFHHIRSTQTEELDYAFDDENGEKTKLVHLLDHLHEQRLRLDPLFRGPSSYLFWDAFGAELDELFAADASSFTLDPNVPRDLSIRLLSNAYLEVVRWWFDNGLEQEPEAVLAYCGFNFA